MANSYAQYGPSSETFPATVASKGLRRNASNTGWVYIGPDDDLATGSASGYMSTGDKSKLDGMESSATADQTDSEIKTAYEANSDTNAFTDALLSKVNGVEAAATADQSNSEIKTAYEANSDTNAFTDSEQSKLSAVEASADVTDDANVRSALAAATADIAFNSKKLTSLGAPTASTDAATKSYVDAAIEGLDVKDSVRCTTTSSIADLSAGPLTIDGVTLVAGDRVLVKDTASNDGIESLDAKRNGIYTVGTIGGDSGAWTRSDDADASSEVNSGMFTWIEEGSTNSDSGWVLTTDGTITLDTTGLTYSQFSGAGQITAGAGMTKSGNTMDLIANGDGSITVNTDDLQVGILATDAQHGTRGGGTQHAAATTSVDGFMSSGDKTKLDGYGESLTGTAQTTNATTGTLATHTPTDSTVVTIHAVVSARKNDGTQGAGYTLMGTFRRSGGTTTQIGSTTILAAVEDDAAWDASFATSGADVQVRMTGVAATTIDWRCRSYIVEAP